MARGGGFVNVAVLGGGVGGSRFARAVVENVPPAGVTVIVNVGDDLEIVGLCVSPDLDSVLYLLSGLVDEERGWGRADETWNALETIRRLGGEAWFALGDRDIGLHLVRTQALRAGESLSSFTDRMRLQLGIEARIVPATDDRLETWISTAAGDFSFEEWFVARGHADPIDSISFRGAETAAAAPGVAEALAEADVIMISPSNPHVSIGPIVAVRAIREALERRTVPCVAVSPLIGGRALKGPAEPMLERLEGGTTAAHVAGCYTGLIDALVFDEADADDADAVAALGVQPVVTRTLMRDRAARRVLVEAALDVVGAHR